MTTNGTKSIVSLAHWMSLLLRISHRFHLWKHVSRARARAHAHITQTHCQIKLQQKQKPIIIFRKLKLKKENRQRAATATASVAVAMAMRAVHENKLGVCAPGDFEIGLTHLRPSDTFGGIIMAFLFLVVYRRIVFALPFTHEEKNLHWMDIGQARKNV